MVGLVHSDLYHKQLTDKQKKDIRKQTIDYVKSNLILFVKFVALLYLTSSFIFILGFWWVKSIDFIFFGCAVNGFIFMCNWIARVNKLDTKLNHKIIEIVKNETKQQ
jgi:hypothetical protein